MSNPKVYLEIVGELPPELVPYFEKHPKIKLPYTELDKTRALCVIEYAKNNWDLEILEEIIVASNQKSDVRIPPKPTTDGHNLAVPYDQNYYMKRDKLEEYDEDLKKYRADVKCCFLDVATKEIEYAMSTPNEEDSNMNYWLKRYWLLVERGKINPI